MKSNSAKITNNMNTTPLNLKTIMQIHGDMHKFERGKFLPMKFQKGNFICFIVSGAVKFSNQLSRGEEIIIDLFLNGDIIILKSINFPDRNNTAIAIETTYARVLPIHKFEEISQEHPSLQNQLLIAVSNHIDSLQRRLVFLRYNATKRVTEFLIDLIKWKRISPNDSIYLPLSRYEIGCYLGLTAETVCRILCQLEINGIIRKKGRSIEVLDYDALLDSSGHLRSDPKTKATLTGISAISN